MRLKESVEKVLNAKQKHRWTSEQMQVPPQTEGESCGYRMLYNINRVCEQRKIQAIDREETALEGYMIEMIRMMLNKHQDRQKEEEGRVRKKTRIELSQEKRTNEQKIAQECKKRGQPNANNEGERNGRKNK